MTDTNPMQAMLATSKLLAERNAALREAALLELDAVRADLREAMALLRAHGQPPDWLKLGGAADWNMRWGKLLAKYTETPDA